MLFTLIRTLMLCLCFMGWFLFLHRKGLPFCFAPAITLTGIGSLLFLAGILNILPYTVGVLLIGGLWLCFSYRKQFRKIPTPEWTPLVVFAGLSLLFFLRVWDAHPIIYDTFSHWLVVTKNTFLTHSFPNFQSELISFQGYPPGTAGFAYFICMILGVQTDGFVLFSQGLQIAAALTTMLAFLNKKNLPASAMIILCTWIYALIASPLKSEPLCEPLPDTLISILSIASMAVIVFYRSHPKKAAWYSLPIQVFLAAVKNSGLFLLIFNSVLLAYYTVCQTRKEPKQFRSRAVAKNIGIHCGIPFLVFFLWNQHVDYVFTHGSTSKHTVSMENYRGTLGAKTFPQIFEILEQYLIHFFSPGDRWLLLILAILLFGGIYLLYKNSSKKTAVLHVFTGIISCYVVYMMGLAMMYLVSMDYNEALGIGSFERYEKTVVIYLVACIAVFLLEWLRSLENTAKMKIWQAAAISVIAVILMTQAPRIPSLFIKTYQYEGSSYQFLQEVKDTYQIPDGSTCIVYGSPVTQDYGYHGNMSRYVFWSKSRAYAPPADNLPPLSTLRDTYDYLILMDCDSTMEAFLKANGMVPGKTVYTLK